MRQSLILALLCLPLAAGALAVSHSGYALGANDAPLTGTHAFVFRITDGSGATVWTSNSCDLTLSAGYYATTIGGACAGGAALTSDLLPSGATRLLVVTIDGVALAPSVTLAPAPTAGDSARLAGYDLAGLQGLFDTRYAPVGTAVRVDPVSAQTGSVNVTGTVTANAFAGGGAALTGLSAANVSTGVLPVARGGTGAGTFTTNAVLVGGGTSAIGVLGSLGTTGQFLTSAGNSAAPAWTTLSATNITTGTLAVAQGGTGAGSFTANALLLGGGTGSLFPLGSFGTAGQVLTSTGNGNAPTWATPAATGSGVLEANMIRSDGGGGTGSNVTMLSLTTDLTGKTDRWIHLYGGTAISETSNTSNTSILRVVIFNGTTTTVVSALRQGIGAHSNVVWSGDTTSAMSVQGYFKVTPAFAVPNVSIRLTGGIDGNGFTWGDQTGYTNFDGEQAGGYLGYAVF